jgi:hypothetical protein
MHFLFLLLVVLLVVLIRLVLLVVLLQLVLLVVLLVLVLLVVLVRLVLLVVLLQLVLLVVLIRLILQKDSARKSLREGGRTVKPRTVDPCILQLISSHYSILQIINWTIIIGL